MVNVFFDFATEAEISQELGHRIAQQRIKKNITQAELASRAAVSISTIKRLEKGEGATLGNFIRVLNSLGLVNDLSQIAVKPTFSIQEFEEMNSITPRKRASHFKG